MKRRGKFVNWILVKATQAAMPKSSDRKVAPPKHVKKPKEEK